MSIHIVLGKRKDGIINHTFHGMPHANQVIIPKQSLKQTQS
jgi:hypothetical protein